MKIRRLKCMDILFVLTIILCLEFKFISFPFFFKYALAWIWIGSYFVKERKVKLGKSTMIYVWPLLTFYIVSLLLFILNSYRDISLISLVLRATSLAIQKITAILFAYCSIMRLKEHFLTDTLLGLVINNIIGIIYAVLRYGVGEFLRFLSNPFSSEWSRWVRGGKISDALELHELTFTLGFFIILAIAFKEIRFYKNRRNAIAIICILIILGFKRIQIAGLATVLFVNYLILKKKKKRTSRFAINFITIGTLFVSLLYIFLISSREIAVLATQYNINFMSRLEWYLSISDVFSFSPLYIGRGWGSLSLIIEDINVVGIHSDVLRMYVDAGFIGFIAWIIYYFKFIPSYYLSKAGNAYRVYVIFMIYAIITYLTDNTLNYFVFQMVLIGVPMLIELGVPTNKLSNSKIE